MEWWLWIAVGLALTLQAVVGTVLTIGFTLLGSGMALYAVPGTGLGILRGDPRLLIARKIRIEADLFLGLIIDCSGSMQSDSIRQAIAALELCLRSLSVGDTFNVCRFGSSFELMRSEPLWSFQAG